MVAVMEGYVGPSEAARQLGIAPVTLRLWVKQGKMPALRTPNGIVLRTEDIEQARRQRVERQAAT